MLRLRSDEQLVALFRAGQDEAFRVIHDRYRQRLFAYTRQMLPGSRQDAEDALQDVFVRAYASLRASERDLALRAWLYRVAHNRCIDELRRPPPPAPELLEFVRAPAHDPIAEAEQRESLRRLIADVRRLPEQQRSALLMRELSGMSYSELADALGTSVPAVKSLLVRARVGLAQAQEARDTACSEIRDELIGAHDRRVRPNATARRHMRDCAGCRQFRSDMRGVSRQFAALVPTLGPVALIGNLLGIGGGAGGSAAAGGGAAAGGAAAGGGGAAAAGTGALAAGGVLATGASHVATLLAAAVVTATGAVAVQHTLSPPVKHHVRHHTRAAAKAGVQHTAAIQPAPSSTAVSTPTYVDEAPAASEPASPPKPAPPPPVAHPRSAVQPPASAAADPTTPQPASAGGSPPVDAPTGTNGTGGAPGSEPAGAPGASGGTASTGTAQTPSSGTPAPGTPSDSTTQGTSGTQVNTTLIPTQPSADATPSDPAAGTSTTPTAPAGSDSGSVSTGTDGSSGSGH